MTPKEQAVSDAMLAKLAEKCAMACCSEAFPSTATFETRILKVLREHAASHPLEQQQAVSGDGVERVARAIALAIHEASPLLRCTSAKNLTHDEHCVLARAALTASGMLRMREALEPFAKAADIKLCGEWADDKHFGQTDVGFYLTFGDLRRARTALQEVGRDD